MQSILLISTGNIKNNELEKLLSRNLQQMTELFKKNDFIEMDRSGLTIHA